MEVGIIILVLLIERVYEPQGAQNCWRLLLLCHYLQDGPCVSSSLALIYHLND